jgi:glycosyltransferase involved in cell wall biosynthesis
MASGLPVVASNLPSIREVITDMETGMLAAPDDVDAWCSCIDQIVSNRTLAASIGARGRDLLIEKYTWISRARKVLGG